MDLVFFLKKVDRQSAIIHVFTETPPTQRSRKGHTVHATWITFILYRAQQTNVNKYLKINFYETDNPKCYKACQSPCLDTCTSVAYVYTSK